MAPMKETMYAAIDVGTTKIATMVAKVSTTGTVEVVALGHSTSGGMRKGMVVNPAELTDSIRRSVDEARAMLGSDLPPVHVGITGGHLTCINAASNLARQRKGGVRTFSQGDVDRLLNSTVQQSDERRRIVHVVPRTYQVDGLRGVRNPIGMNGEKLSVESHVVVGDAATMDNLERVVRAAGVKVQGMVIEHLASAEAVLTSDEREAGVVLVDIGGGTADIAIYRGGTAWYTAAIPVAGQHFTNDIAIGLGLPPTVAEAAKVRYGSALLGGLDDPKEVIEVESGLGEHTRPISRQTLNQLLHDRAVELVRMVLHKVGQAGLTRVPPGGIVLTGGCANLPGLAEIAADYGKCEVRVGTPPPTLGLPPELEQSSFSTAVGLLLWAIQHRHPGAIATSVTLNTGTLDKIRGWMSKLASRRVLPGRHVEVSA
jgi:cell division protein FtsA